MNKATSRDAVSVPVSAISGKMSCARSLDALGETSGYPLILDIVHCRVQRGIES